MRRRQLHRFTFTTALAAHAFAAFRADAFAEASAGATLLELAHVPPTHVYLALELDGWNAQPLPATALRLGRAALAARAPFAID